MRHRKFPATHFYIDSLLDKKIELQIESNVSTEIFFVKLNSFCSGK